MQESQERSTSASALTTGRISYRKPYGLIVSTGNLYFTSRDGNTAAVWRCSQSAIPGQEILLWSEPEATFGDITFAQVDGVWWGYFFKTPTTSTFASIRRVPLTGGAASDVNPQVENVDVVNSHRNLVTDGVNLYWQDVDSVRKMPIRGGTVTVLDRASPNTPTAGLALQTGKLIYASVADIRYVPTSGDATTTPQVRTIVTASSRVTALHAVSNGVYWGEQSGAVRLIVGSTVTTLPSSAGLVPTSVSTSGFTAGADLVCTQCGSQSCQLQCDFASTNFAMAIGADALGATITSSGTAFWGDAAGVHRHVF